MAVLRGLRVVLAAGIIGVIAFVCVVAAGFAPWQSYRNGPEIKTYISPFAVCRENTTAREELDQDAHWRHSDEEEFNEAFWCISTFDLEMEGDFCVGQQYNRSSDSFFGPKLYFEAEYCSHRRKTGVSIGGATIAALLGIILCLIVPCTVTAKMRTQAIFSAVVTLLFLLSLFASTRASITWKTPVQFCNGTNVTDGTMVPCEKAHFIAGRIVAHVHQILTVVVAILLAVLSAKLYSGKASLSTAFDAHGNPTKAWGGGLFAIFADTEVCITTALVPCLVAGDNYSDIREGDKCTGALAFMAAFCCGVHRCFLGWMRFRIFDRLNQPRMTCSDIMSFLCCPFLALAQDRRGVKETLATTAPRFLESKSINGEFERQFVEVPPPYQIVIVEPGSSTTDGVPRVPLFDPYTGERLPTQPAHFEKA